MAGKTETLRQINAYVSRARSPRKIGEMEMATDKGKRVTVPFDQYAAMSVNKFLAHVGPAVTQKPQAARQVATKPDTGPTPQRRAKAPYGLATAVVKRATVYEPEQVVHKVRQPLDLYGQHFTTEEMHVAQLFCLDAEVATSARITAQYDGVSRGTPGARSGGVPDRYRERYVRFSQVWSALDDRTKSVLAHLILCVRNEQLGRSATIQEVGQACTAFKDKATSKGVGVGLMKAALWRLHQLYVSERTKHRR